jgi:hypothetical protein
MKKAGSAEDPAFHSVNPPGLFPVANAVMVMPMADFMAVVTIVVMRMHTDADANPADMNANTDAGRSRGGAQQGKGKH